MDHNFLLASPTPPKDKPPEIVYPASQIDRCRYWNVEDNWWTECHEVNLRADMEAVGFIIANVAWSGFSSQGAGASFTGQTCDFAKFLDAVAEGDETKFPFIRALLAKEAGLTFYVRRDGSRYYHENTVNGDVKGDEFRDLLQYDGPEFLIDVALAMDNGLDKELPDFCGDALGYVREKMHEYYITLEDDYDYLTSDEAVIEAMRAADAEPELHDDEGD